MALSLKIGQSILQALQVPSYCSSLCRSFASKSKKPNYRAQCDGFEPPCGEKRLKEKKAKGECQEDKQKKSSMWLNPECCLDLCKDVMPRFDDLYYKPSDKSKRKYTRTWNECPELRIVPKKLCCYENIKYPPMEKRKKKDIPDTACPIVTEEERASCATLGNKRCRKIRLPGCGVVRDPPRCFVIKPPSNCRKICAPYPSFSECNRKKPRPRHPVECKCLVVGPICH